MSFTQNLAKAYRTHRRKAWVLGGGLGFIFLQSYTGYNPLASVFRTTGTRSIEERYSSGGAAPTHTPGAGTPRGKPNQTDPVQSNPNGVGTEKFAGTHGEQKPAPSGFDKGLNKAFYGDDKGKH